MGLISRASWNEWLDADSKHEREWRVLVRKGYGIIGLRYKLRLCSYKKFSYLFSALEGVLKV